MAFTDKHLKAMTQQSDSTSTPPSQCVPGT